MLESQNCSLYHIYWHGCFRQFGLSLLLTQIADVKKLNEDPIQELDKVSACRIKIWQAQKKAH